MGARVKIALFHNLPSGGAKRTVLETVRRLADRHVVDLFCPTTADSAFCDVRPYVTRTLSFPFQRSKPLPSPFGRLSRVLALGDLYRMERLARQVAGAIDDRGYDVALVHPCVVTHAPSVLRYLRTPTVYYCHEVLRGLYERPVPRPYRRRRRLQGFVDRVDALDRFYRGLLARIDRRNVRSASRVLTNSIFTQAAIDRAYGVRASVNHPGVDTTFFRPIDVPKERMVLSVGSLTAEKGFDFLIAGLAGMPVGERPRLALVSNVEVSAERLFLERLAHASGVDVSFEVGISNDELVRRYNSALLTVYAPYGEPLGLAALESQSCQTPVVGVAEGGVLETVLDRQTGRLVPREPAAFASTVRSLLAAPDLLRDYGSQGRAHVLRSWSWDFLVDEPEGELSLAARLGGETPLAARTAPSANGVWSA